MRSNVILTHAIAITHTRFTQRKEAEIGKNDFYPEQSGFIRKRPANESTGSAEDGTEVRMKIS